MQADLTAWAQEIVKHYSNPVNAALLRGGASAAGEQQSYCLRNRSIEANLFLDRYPDSGVTADDILDTVIAPIVYRVIFLPWTLEDTTAEHLVSRLFR